MESFVQAIISSLPANDAKLHEYRQWQVEDEICSQIIQSCQSEWPDEGSVSSDLQPYWTVRTELSYINGLLLFRNRIVIPRSLQRMTLQKIHQGHQGISKCYERVLTAVWWLGDFKDLEAFVRTCPQCCQTTPLTSEPLLPNTLPTFPWQMVAVDLGHLK
uniref:Integrase zinc-binding domain-containing protein n=1 Tax=Amphimedon queenslandica TaxID=400682 RepID=A0A1X7TI73_AMPQE